MPQTVNITITSSGPDLGPYNIYLVDGSNNVYPGPAGIPKSLLAPPGYTFTIDTGIVKVRLQSVNETCPYTEFIVPTPLPECTCYYLKATEGSVVFWTDCDGNIQQNIYDSFSPIYCAKRDTINVIDDPTAIIYGGTEDCSGGICPDSPSCNCSVITNIDEVDVDVTFLNCYGHFATVTIIPNGVRSICGAGFISATGLINIVNGEACTPTGEGGIMVCPPIIK